MKENPGKNSRYGSISYWLETAGDDLTPRPSLKESKTTDVAILGAGFTGLWTAYYLSQKKPSLKIIILEKEITGFGASGRNGGWCLPGLSVSPSAAIKRYGLDTARNLQMAMFDSVTEVGSVIQKEEIDADWKLGGSLEVALGEYGLPALESELQTYKELGMDDQLQLLNKEETDQRVRIHETKSSLFTKHSAVLNPGKLVRGLARILEQRGVEIYEETEVLDVKEGDSGTSPTLVTRNGTVSAKHAVVLAGEAYLTKISKFHRNLVPMYSLITLTEPLTEEQWSEIGWEGRETVGSTRLSVDYLQRTDDGRILFGGRGQPYRYASQINESFDRHEPTHQMLQKMAIKWFPTIAHSRFTHNWGGPLGITRDWTPNFTFNKKTRIASAWGYAGQGVSTTNLAGRVLSDLLTEQKTHLTELPISQHKSKNWEIEPFRWLGIRYVQSSLARLDQKAEQTGIAPKGTTMAERLSK